MSHPAPNNWHGCCVGTCVQIEDPNVLLYCCCTVQDSGRKFGDNGLFLRVLHVYNNNSIQINLFHLDLDPLTLIPPCRPTSMSAQNLQTRQKQECVPRASRSSRFRRGQYAQLWPEIPVVPSAVTSVFGCCNRQYNAAFLSLYLICLHALLEHHYCGRFEH